MGPSSTFLIFPIFLCNLSESAGVLSVESRCCPYKVAGRTRGLPLPRLCADNARHGQDSSLHCLHVARRVGRSGRGACSPYSACPEPRRDSARLRREAADRRAIGRASSPSLPRMRPPHGGRALEARSRHHLSSRRPTDACRSVSAATRLPGEPPELAPYLPSRRPC
jgi:hypothetical protein